MIITGTQIMTHQLSQDQLEALVFLKDKKFDYLSLTVAASLVNLHLVETNSADIKDGKVIAARLTQNGVNFIQTLPVQAPQPVQQALWGEQPASFQDSGVHFTAHNQLTPEPVEQSKQPLHKQLSPQAVQQPSAQPKPEPVVQPEKPAIKTAVNKKKDVPAKAAVVASPSRDSTKFKINTVPLPESKRSTYFGAPKYPFNDLQVGQSFFVPISPELPDAVRTLQSAASAANTRYAKKTGETRVTKNGKETKVHQLTRRFLVRPDIGTEQDGADVVGKKGARVGRVQ